MSDGEGQAAEVVVVAVIKVKPGREDEAERNLRGVIGPTHGEAGCLLYSLNRDLNDPARFVLVERWRSRADLEEHLTKPYIQALGESADLMAEPAQVHFLEALPEGDEGKGRI